ncbi:endodeoxyribonuclease [Entomortierella beljakovae]|nr:endodeoxyribonuclease [Entomortierella beljakovae]
MTHEPSYGSFSNIYHSSSPELQCFESAFWSDKSSLETPSIDSVDSIIDQESTVDEEVVVPDLFLYYEEIDFYQDQQQNPQLHQELFQQHHHLQPQQLDQQFESSEWCSAIFEESNSIKSSNLDFDYSTATSPSSSISDYFRADELDNELLVYDDDDMTDSEDEGIHDDDSDCRSIPLIEPIDWDVPQEDEEDSCVVPDMDFFQDNLSSPSFTSPYMETIPQSREWVLEKLELLASQVLHDLSIGKPPVIQLANRSDMEAIVYDEKNGVIRRKRNTCYLETGYQGQPKRGNEDKGKKDNVSDDNGNEHKSDDDGDEDVDGGDDDDDDDDDDEEVEKDDDEIFPPKEHERKSKYRSNNRADSYTKTRRLSGIPATMRVIDLIHENIYKNAISTKRDIFYRDVGLFGSQSIVDNIVEDLACTLQIPRSCLNVVAGSRSIVYGSVRMIIKTRGSSSLSENSRDDSGNTLNAIQQEEGSDSINKKFSRTEYNTLVTIPTAIDDILQVEIYHSTRFILVIEKEATMDNLISLGFCETHGPCILMTSKGYPDRVARQLLKLFSDMIHSRTFIYTAQNLLLDYSSASTLSPIFISPTRTISPCLLDIPMLALVDCDPHGIEIYLTYRCGSFQSAHDNANLAVPALRCLGQLPCDWRMHFNGVGTKGGNGVGFTGDAKIDMVVDRNWERFERGLQVLTARERNKLVSILKLHPFVKQNKEWTRQISIMLMMNRKTELQTLCQDETRDFIVEDGSVIQGKNKSHHHGLVQYIEHKLDNPDLWL